MTQLLMPLIYNGMKNLHPAFEAWRWAFFVPGFFHIISGIGILFFSTDLPTGNYAALKAKGGMTKDGGLKVMINALRNYRCAAPPTARCAQRNSRPTHLAPALTILCVLCCLTLPVSVLRAQAKLACCVSQPADMLPCAVQNVVPHAHLRLLLRHRADHQQHHCRVPIRPVWRLAHHCRPHRLPLRCALFRVPFGSL